MSVFSTSSASSAKFEQPGDIVQGPIAEIGEPFHATKYNTQDKDFWPSGDPVMNVAITLQTQQRDPSVPDDEGKRRIYITVSGKEGGQLWAVKQALRAAGAKDLAVGGHLAMRYTGPDPESKNPANPRKLYQAQYQAPVGGGVFGDEQPAQPQYQQAAPQQQAPVQQMQGGWPQAQQAQQGQAAAPAQQYQEPVQVNPGTGEVAPQQQTATAAPQHPQVDAQQVKSLIAAGLSDQQINAATGANFEQIAAIRNLG